MKVEFAGKRYITENGNWGFVGKIKINGQPLEEHDKFNKIVKRVERRTENEWEYANGQWWIETAYEDYTVEDLKDELRNIGIIVQKLDKEYHVEVEIDD